MTEQLPATTAVGTAPPDFVAIAKSPAEMVTCQANMIEWCEQKRQSEIAEMVDADTNAERARKSKWPSRPWERRSAANRKKVEFYDKVIAALKAGYYIIPPFPMQVFAIRTKKSDPKRVIKKGFGHDHEQKAQNLAVGAGEYQNPIPIKEEWLVPGKNSQGQAIEVTHSAAAMWADMQFPFRLARGEILEATTRAMALKVFDEMGVLPQYRAPDPIVCGSIIMPHKNNARLHFFVAWWLDTRTL